MIDARTLATTSWYKSPTYLTVRHWTGIALAVLAAAVLLA